MVTVMDSQRIVTGIEHSQKKTYQFELKFSWVIMNVSRLPILVYSKQDDSSYITVILLHATTKGLYSKLLYAKIDNLLL